MKSLPDQATCAVCLEHTQCVTKRDNLNGGVTETQNFQYSEIHNGWLCRKCSKRLEKQETLSGWPEREPLEME